MGHPVIKLHWGAPGALRRRILAWAWAWACIKLRAVATTPHWGSPTLYRSLTVMDHPFDGYRPAAPITSYASAAGQRRYQAPPP